MERTSTLTSNSSFSLSLQIDSDGFTLSVFDKSDSFLTSKRVDARLSDLSLDEVISMIKAETQLNFKNINISIESNTYVIIPMDLFRMDEAADFLFLEHKPSKTDSILFNKIPEFGIVDVFTIPGKIHEAISQLFPMAEISHHLSQFISEKVNCKIENCIYCFPGNKKVDIVVIKNSKLLLVNSFSYQTPEDFLYFTLNVYEKLSLDIHKVPVYLFNPLKKFELEKLLAKYITVCILQPIKE